MDLIIEENRTFKKRMALLEEKLTNQNSRKRQFNSGSEDGLDDRILAES